MIHMLKMRVRVSFHQKRLKKITARFLTLSPLFCKPNNKPIIKNMPNTVKTVKANSGVVKSTETRLKTEQKWIVIS